VYWALIDFLLKVYKFLNVFQDFISRGKAGIDIESHVQLVNQNLRTWNVKTSI